MGSAAEAAGGEAAEAGVFGGAALDPGPPAAEGARLEVAAHEGAHFVFLEPELHLDGLERRAVLPGHADQAVEVVFGEVRHLHSALMTKRGRFRFNHPEARGAIVRADGVKVLTPLARDGTPQLQRVAAYALSNLQPPEGAPSMPARTSRPARSQADAQIYAASKGYG